VPVLAIDREVCEPDDLRPAVEWLRAGHVVVLPTDTFYGIAVDPASETAVRHVFDLKGREAGAALPLVAASLAQVEACCGRLSSSEARLAAAFWPGPLSLVLDAPDRFVPAVHAGRRSIAIRVPDDAIARGLCERWGGPLTATSANRSGDPPARAAADLGTLADDPRVLVIDAGLAPGGAPSTLVDARVMPPLLVRPGAIAWDRVLRSLQA